LPFSLSLSFYPLLLADFGYGEDGTGVLLGLRALGAIAAGLVAARFVRTGPQTPWPVICGLVTVATSALLPLLNHAALIALWLFIAGLGSGAMTIYFQVTISEASKLEERGSALALGGVGWSISHLSTPLIMGFIADRHGLAVAFYCIGVVGLAATAFVAWARKRAFD
jgi:MFS family permease